jgi:hypothetical protein
MFYKTDRGAVINLDHLVKVLGHADDRVAVMSDGSSVRLLEYEIDQIVEMTRSVVAARPDDRAVVFTWYGDGDTPTHDAQDVPVIAWALDGEVMAPVFADQIIEGQRVGILMPDGTVCAPYNCTWPSRQSFIESSVESFKRQDAHRRPAEAA